MGLGQTFWWEFVVVDVESAIIVGADFKLIIDLSHNQITLGTPNYNVSINSSTPSAAIVGSVTFQEGKNRKIKNKNTYAKQFTNIIKTRLSYCRFMGFP